MGVIHTISPMKQKCAEQLICSEQVDHREPANSWQLTIRVSLLLTNIFVNL